MPHPRKHMKLTGDTHPPEVEDDLGREEKAPHAGRAPASRTADSREAGRAARAPCAWPGWRGLPRQARAQVRSRPLTAAFAAFASASRSPW
jgi:hypothetical protein